MNMVKIKQKKHIKNELLIWLIMGNKAVSYNKSKLIVEPY